MQRTKTTSLTSDLIEPGHAYSVEDALIPGNCFQLECIDVVQRNWSRVGMGRLAVSPASAQQRVFVKQNIDKGGSRQPEHWRHEQTGAAIAAKLLADIVQVPTLSHQNEQLLINVFEYVDLITLDELLRIDPVSFDKYIEPVTNQLIRVLEAMSAPSMTSLADALPVKRRTYGGPSTAVNFKGFEIRNTGLARTEDGLINPDNLVAFDFVRPYLAPIEEAAAKLFVSIGLLNWGKPLDRFARGPDTSLLERILPVLRPYLDGQAIRAELGLQARFRTHEFQGSSTLERMFKQLGIDMLGKRYLRKLERWCERNIK